MSLETMKRVSEAEKAAAAAAAAAEAEAVAALGRAETDGEELLSRTHEECRAEAQALMTQTERRAADTAREIAAQNEQDCLALRASAGKKLAEAQAFILRKVVER